MKQMTVEQMRDEFLTAIADAVINWHEHNRITETRGKLAGLAFSILVILDEFEVIPKCESEWMDGWNKENIAGDLHDHWYRIFAKKRQING